MHSWRRWRNNLYEKHDDEPAEEHHQAYLGEASPAHGQTIGAKGAGMTPKKLLDALAANAHARASVFGPDDSSVVYLLEMRKGVLELIQANEELARALGDCLSTYRHDDKETVVTAERQEAWAEVLAKHGPKPGGPMQPL